MKFRERNYAYPLHHVTVKQRVKLKSGKLDHFIVLYVKPKNSTSPIIFKELFNFFSHRNSKSLSWQRHVARAIGLFFDYCIEKACVYKNDNNVADAIRGFVECSLSGDSQLGWAPSSVGVVKRNLAYIMDFSKGTSEQIGASLLPVDDGDIRLRYFYRAYEVKQNSLLSHVTDVKSVAARLRATSSEHIYQFSRPPNIRNLKLFPEDLIEPLFKYGFTKSDGSEDLGTKMLTALLLFGGMRESEPFHLWFNDFSIYPSTGKLAIFLHHPSEASCNIPPYKNMLRKEYLMERHLKPRNDKATSKSYHAGWKDLAVDNFHRTEIALIHEVVEQHFVLWWSRYMELRQNCMKSYVKKHGVEHPFFFVKTGDKNDLGAPLSISAYIKALKRAVARLEKMGYMAEWGVSDGIAPHPMRHWFITKLSENDVSNKIIQELANHRNILSQEIYKGTTAKEIDLALRKISNSYAINLERESC
ncbi:site-specific integrase [Alteromonas stellipolaris]|uniref:site-specific integrase n=1 Tax=Alteromonas stellipolaris TaxID=233316 RepID=UPI001D3D8F75|nr:site-specific integrase [Alteromonas stellipolaris]MBZ2161606.1 site-specific integrase [Alteromonas stellipolaris]